MAERLAIGLEVYIQLAQVFAVRWKREFFTGDLFSCISSWRERPSDINGDQLVTMLRGHYSELEKIEKDYAARWI